jgi:phosphoserine aminotransferase
VSRKYNFYAGPSTLPLEVLEIVQREFVDFEGQGVSMIETSHRSSMYDHVHNRAVELFKEIFAIPENYSVLFLGGGATLQFSMVPLNFLGPDQTCDFTLSGSWAKKAYNDAKKVGKVRVIFDGAETNYSTLPKASSLETDPNAAYLHLTSNETIGGIQWKEWPHTGSVPLICDMSSDLLSRAVPVEKFALIYGGAQKNLGPAGVTVAILRDDMLRRCPDTLTAYLDYRTHADKNSLYNTPPVFAIWVIQLVLERMKRLGGMKAMEEHNAAKAAEVYKAIDTSGGFYRCPVDKDVRSLMNLVFRLPSEDLEKRFISQATEEGFLGLKGHRSVGGCRASLYNAMPLEGARALGEFMNEFARKNG